MLRGAPLSRLRPTMTKKERAKKIQETLIADFMPQIGKTMFIEVQALGKDRLLIEVLNNHKPDSQVFLRLEIGEPDIVRKIYEMLLEGPSGDEDVHRKRGGG